MVGVILYQIEKPANLGNIFRTAEALGIKLFIIGPLTFDMNSKEFKRAGMDYINSVSFKYYENLDEFKKDFKGKTIYYVTRYADKTYSSFDYSSLEENIYFMFGKESTGIPKDLLKENFDKCIRIPMTPSSRSLNLSNSVAIVLYEAFRQRNFFGLATKEVLKGEDFLKNYQD